MSRRASLLLLLLLPHGGQRRLRCHEVEDSKCRCGWVAAHAEVAVIVNGVPSRRGQLWVWTAGDRTRQPAKQETDSWLAGKRNAPLCAVSVKRPVVEYRKLPAPLLRCAVPSNKRKVCGAGGDSVSSGDER